VTGYLYNPSADNGDTTAIGAGTTHAWVDIYLPGTGWNHLHFGGHLGNELVSREHLPVGERFDSDQ